MAATRVVNGLFREVWQELVPLDGGSADVITTGIKMATGDLGSVSGMLSLGSAINSPAFVVTTAIVNEVLVVTVTNSAPPGNMATFVLDVTKVHTIQQVPDPVGVAQIHVASAQVAASALPGNTVVGETSFSQASTAGASGLFSRADHSHGTPSDAPLEHVANKDVPNGYPSLDALGTLTASEVPANVAWEKAEELWVAKTGADYTDPRAAVLVANAAAAAATPYIVHVAAGVYDVQPFPISPYVKLSGEGGLSTVLRTLSNVAHFITMDAFSEISDMAILGPTGANQAAIRSNGVAGIALINKVILLGGYYGILCDPAAGGFTYVGQAGYLPSGGTMHEFLRVTGNGVARADLVNLTDPGGTLTHGYVVDGASADLTLISCGHSVTGGTDGVFIDNSARLKALACLFENGTNAIHVGSNGAPFVAAHACMIRGIVGGYTHDILIDTINATVHYSGSLSRVRVDNAVGASLSINATDIQPGADEGAMVLGEFSLGPTVGGMTPMLDYGKRTWLTGLVSGGEVTRHGAGSRELHIASGRGFINDGNHAHQSIWGPLSVTIAANSTEYVYIDLAGNAQHSAVQPSYADNIVLAQAVADANDIVLLTRDEITIEHQASRIQEYLEDVVGPINIDGATTGINGGVATRIDINTGEFMVGLSERDVDPLVATPFYYWYRTGAVWTMVASTDVDTGNYNDPAAGLAALAGAWKKDMVYIVVGGDGTEIHVVYGQETFINQGAAEAGNNPGPPDILNHYAQRSGGLVIHGGVAAIASVTDARPRLGQAATTTVAAGDHDLLLHLANDTHAQYLTVARANAWLAAMAPLALVTNGDTHDHTAGAGNQIDHTTCSNIGVNTHAQIDAHLIDVANPHVVTAAQVGSPPTARTLTAGAGLTGGGDLSANRTFDVGAHADGSIVVNANDVQVGILATDAQHGVRGGGTQHAAVVAGVSNGFMTAADKTKLDSILNPLNGNSFQSTSDVNRTTLTGANSNVYPPVGAGTKLTLTTPALVAGTYKLSWSVVADYSANNRAIYIRIQNTTDAVTLWEVIWQPNSSSSRRANSGFAYVVFAGVAKTFLMEFHNTNVGDTSGMAYAHMQIERVS